MNRFVDLLFPTVCAACGRLGPIICPACLMRFPQNAGPFCQRCGRQAPETCTTCSFCSEESFNLSQSRSCYPYSEPLITLIHKFKYHGLFALAEPLGQNMVHFWPDWEYLPDLIVPVPLHERRWRARGFNQSQLLAQQLGPAVGVEINSCLLKRVRNTRPQVHLTPEKRARNVAGAFIANSTGVAGKHILMVDDVITTGATMFSAAQSLLDAGAKTVSAYSLAHAVH